MDDRHALITGASAGLGLEFARQLHARGALVTLVARRRDRLERLAAEMNGVRPGSAEILAADLARWEDADNGLSGLRTVCALISARRVDVLVNNAGFGSFGAFDGLDAENERRMIRVNVEAPLLLTRAVLPQMKERRDGTIINLSSIAAFQPLPFMATYAATKAFDYFHSLALRAELKPHGITVFTVCPGPTTTEFGRTASVPQDLLSTSGRAEDVVRKSLAALERGEASITPGVRWALLAQLCRLLPAAVTVPLVAAVMRRSAR